MSLTKTASEMIKNKKGYRTESYSGSKVTDIEEVIYYEIGVLRNTDIIDFLDNTLKLNFNKELEELVKESKEDNIKHFGKEEFESDETILAEIESESINTLLSENYRHYMEEIIEYCIDALRVSSKEELEARWLTTKENVKEIYGAYSDEEIDEYCLDREFLIISDLGRDGCLFIFRK